MVSVIVSGGSTGKSMVSRLLSVTFCRYVHYAGFASYSSSCLLCICQLQYFSAN